MKKMQTIAMILFAVGACVVVACNKYKDPEPPDITLTNPYCNDPIAVNYNYGFPGIPDSSVCIYATDLIEGDWVYQDSIFKSDSTFSDVHTYTLQIRPDPSDTLKSKLLVKGFCSNNNDLLITSNRYGNAITDTLLENVPGGQYFCSNNDTVSGTFIRTRDTLHTTMNINLFQQNNTGQYYHRGIATKQ